MLHPSKLRIEDFAYDLPDERIAKYPLEKRSKSNVLVYENGKIKKTDFENIVELLPENTLLVYNNTKVFYARLEFIKSTGAKIEVFCLEPVGVEITQAMQLSGKATWKCMVGNAKKWKNENLVLQTSTGTDLKAKLNGKDGNDYLVEFEWDSDVSFSELMEELGKVPLPPYIKRKAEEADKQRYQTVYSKEEGSVAAPTAGLHFTKETLNKIDEKGIKRLPITLHVGAGTFQPVKSETMQDHDMHAEVFSFEIEQLKTLGSHIKKGSHLVVVGTTSMRALESLYWIGLQDTLHLPTTVSQWLPYENKKETSSLTSVENIISQMMEKGESQLMGKTSIIIAPSYTFKFANGLITNFHQSKSTLLLLVAALIGKDWKSVYDYALKNDFRFLSYGDSSLLWGALPTDKLINAGKKIDSI